MLMPKTIESDEPCVRCIFHPMMCSEHKRSLKREALLSAKNKREVLLLRLRYTTQEFCINHGKTLQMKGNTFCCLATITKIDIEEVDTGDGVSCNLRYAPMHKGEYVGEQAVYVADPNVDLPMHADMIYNQPLEEGSVQARMRKYASQLIKRMKVIYQVTA